MSDALDPASHITVQVDNRVAGPRPAEGTAESPAWLSSGGRYALVSVVAQGGMGRVYRVFDHELQREVALKVLLPHISHDWPYIARFIEEARAVGQLEHPNVIPVHDIAMAPSGDLFFTMKFVNGETLGEVVHRLSKAHEPTFEAFPFTRRLRIVLHVCEALTFAQSRGVLHRDVKPGNVMIGPYGEVTLMDWGLARRLNTETPPLPGEHQPMSIAALADSLPKGDDHVRGTPGFVAPEVLNGGEATVVSDVYSLGVLMYWLFAIRTPYPVVTRAELTAKILLEDPPAPEVFAHPIQGRVPREISLIIMKAMHREPAMRYQTPKDVADALTLYIRGLATPVCAHTHLKSLLYKAIQLVDNHGSRVMLALGVSAGLMVGLIVACWLIFRHP